MSHPHAPGPTPLPDISETDPSVDSPPATWPVEPRFIERGERPRAPIYVALFVVAALAGSALFVSGFTLGAQQAATPGTSDENQARFQPFWDAWHKVTTEYVGELDQKALVEGAIKGMFEAIGDPYSAYMTSEEYRQSLQGISGQFEGIGAEMTSRGDEGDGCAPISDECRLIVVRVLRKSPALEAGLRENDQVIAVDGTPVLGSTLEETVLKVRGKKGTTVKLSLLRDGEPVELEIERDVIETEAVTSRTMDGGEVGYLKIAGFSSSAAEDFREQLEALVDQGVSGVILDLRDDPGGFVDAARDIASEFIAEGPIYWEEKADGERTVQNAKPGGVATDPSLELVVLVNGGTASASEIVAGALQDSERGTLVGQKTFGKGTIQQWIELPPDSGGFRLSVAKWLTPEQTWIHGTGITPDVVVDPAPNAQPGEDRQLDRALELLADGTRTGMLPVAA